MKRPAVPLSRLLESSGVRPIGEPAADPEIRGACLDSRRVEPGDLFFALRGIQTDGEKFVPQALQRGAQAVVAESERPSSLPSGIGWVRVENPRRDAGLLSRELYGRPDESLTLIGVTGTNGKTTVTYLVEAIARAAGIRAGRMGTVTQTFDGIERQAVRTTPEAPDLYRTLFEMRQHEIKLVVMEVSSHALALHRVEGARFAAALFLNLSRDHHDFHKDEAAYFNAKARLFDGLGPEQQAVISADSGYCAELARRTRARVLTFGRASAADVRLRDEHCALDGSSAALDTPGGPIPVRTHLPGSFNLENVAAAAACALSLGLSVESITNGTSSVERVPGRMQRVVCGQPFTVLVDFAHTGDALSNLLAWLRSVAKKRLLVVFGCGGDRDRGKRIPMGRAAAMSADLLFLTSDNPRNEDPEAILNDVGQGISSVEGADERCEKHVDRTTAIERAIHAAEPGDVVVIAGKGHETTQTIGDTVRPFDDRLVAAAALKRLGWLEGQCAEA